MVKRTNQDAGYGEAGSAFLQHARLAPEHAGASALLGGEEEPVSRGRAVPAALWAEQPAPPQTPIKGPRPRRQLRCEQLTESVAWSSRARACSPRPETFRGERVVPGKDAPGAGAWEQSWAERVRVRVLSMLCPYVWGSARVCVCCVHRRMTCVGLCVSLSFARGVSGSACVMGVGMCRRLGAGRGTWVPGIGCHAPLACKLRRDEGGRGPGAAGSRRGREDPVRGGDRQRRERRTGHVGLVSALRSNARGLGARRCRVSHPTGRWGQRGQCPLLLGTSQDTSLKGQKGGD